MKKQTLKNKTQEVKTDTKTAIETIINALNQGQRKKIMKDEAVQKLCKIYGVEE